MDERLELEGVGEVAPLELRGDTFTLASPAPKPPGTRLTFRLQTDSEPLAEGKVTSVSVESEEPPRWRLTVKLFSPPRNARKVLIDLTKSES